MYKSFNARMEEMRGEQEKEGKSDFQIAKERKALEVEKLGKIIAGLERRINQKLRKVLFPAFIFFIFHFQNSHDFDANEANANEPTIVENFTENHNGTEKEEEKRNEIRNDKAEILKEMATKRQTVILLIFFKKCHIKASKIHMLYRFQMLDECERHVSKDMEENAQRLSVEVALLNGHINGFCEELEEMENLIKVGFAN